MKNNAIQFWRYIFTCLICVLHFETQYFSGSQPFFRCGYLGVEFFFILSGFFMMKHVEHSQETALAYTWGRIKRFYPDLVISWTLLILNLTWINGYDFLEIWNVIKSHIWEYLLLNSTGITWEMLNGLTWYISALLIAGYFIYWLLKNKRKTYLEFIAPLLIFLIYSYYAYCGVGIDFHLAWIGITLHSILRALGGMSIGCILYAASKKYEIKKLTSVGTGLISFAEILLLIALGFVLFGRAEKTNTDLLALPIFAMLILIEYQGWSILSKLFNHRIFGFLGNISLIMYINQSLIMGDYLRWARKTNFIWDTIVVLAMITMLAIVIYSMKKILLKKKVRISFKIFQES